MAGLSLVAATIALKSLGPSVYQQLGDAWITGFSTIGTPLTAQNTGDILQDYMLVYAKIIIPFVGILVVIGVVAGLLQTQFLFSAKGLIPDLAVLNPMQGLSRIFSLRTVVELLKSLLKMGLIGWVAYRDFMATIPSVPNLIEQGVPAGTAFIAGKTVSALQTIGIGLLVIGVLDYGYQYWEFRKSLRMTKQEIKQEFREQEGSPELRQRQRQRAREMAMRRKALKDVPLADVVVTNPTHYAIAIKYDPKESSAPKVLAKGADLLAQRMKVIAKENDVPMVENRTLARTLYSTVEVGQMVPPELYQAVAEVLAFVYSLRRQKRQEYHETP